MANNHRPAHARPDEAAPLASALASGPPATLTTKLAAVMTAVGRIAKRGRNEYHGYDYATEADIVEAVRRELAVRKIVIFPEVVDYEIRELTPATEKKSARLLTILRLRFSIQDGETGERIERAWIGAGEDSGDKGVYKAMTGGDKYFLLKLLLIPTGDDPEQAGRVVGPARGTGIGRTPHHDGLALDQPTTIGPQPAPPAPAGNPETGEPLNDHQPRGGVYITGVALKEEGQNTRGPWQLFIITTSDGNEWATFDPLKADEASAYCQEHRPIVMSGTRPKGKARPLLKGMTALHTDEEERVL